jgi:tetratricopeptide (TPR) repeat protein
MQELEPGDRAELTKLVNAVALSDRSLSLFAIAPDSAPNHPVVEQFKAQLLELDEPFEFHTLYYSDNSLFDCLHRLDGEAASGRRVVMAFGLEYLPRPRLLQEMQQLNLGRERIFDRNIVLVFWLSRETFLNEFRQQAADFWDWRGNVAYFATRPPSNPLLYPYLQWLIAENSYLKIAGVMQVNRQVDILLDRIYVSLQAEWVEEQSQSFRERVTRGEGRVKPSRPNKLGEPDFPDFEFTDEPMLAVSAEPSSRQRVTKIVDLAEALRKHTYSAILGEPGAGKTTLLRYLARHFAIAYGGLQAVENPTTQSSGEESPSRLRVGEGPPKSRVRGGMGEDLGEIRLPVLFRIADFAERLAQEPDLSLVEYLKQFYRQWECDRDRAHGDAVADLLLAKMAAGDCLVLMDGLDEVFDRANRVQVVQQIDRLLKDYGENKFVITSRIAGYQEASLGSRFRELTITPMGNAQIKEFLERWCRAIEEAQRPEADVSLNEREAQREARGIWQAIETKPGVKRFATNPLLLTILALIHRNGTQLPQRRVELYQLATKTLIEDWQFGRNISYGVKQRQLSLVEEEVTALLAPLAFQMHEEKPSGLVTQAEVEAWLTPKMAELQGVEESDALELVRQFLRKVRETTGLFVERAPAVYGFMHLTFEEYYAARYIADNEIDRIRAIVESKISDQRWEEPILLALSFLNGAFPQRFKTLFESLFRDLIQLGEAMRPNPKFRYLAALKAKLIEIETRLITTAKAKILAILINYCIQTLLIVFRLGASFWLTRKLIKIFSDSKYSAQVILAWEVIQDIELNVSQRSKLLQGLLAAHSIIESINIADFALLPEPPSRFSHKSKKLINLLNRFSSQLRQKYAFLQDLAQINSILEYLKIVITNLLLPDTIIYVVLKIFFEITIDDTNSTSENSDDIVESLDILLTKRTRAVAYWRAGDAYKQRNKYEEAITHYQQSRELYQQLGKEKNVANQWYWMADCYLQWGKYEQALDAAQQDLALRQQLDDLPNIADAYFQLGIIYQYWEKYEDAIAHHQQSRELYQQLGKKEDVANSWLLMAVCYRQWAKYEQALDAAQQDLALRQQLDDLPNIADAYYQLGGIYRDWGKDEDAIAHYQQSRELYQQLGKKKDVASSWYWMAVCYRQWGKYEQALDAAQQDLALRQQLDDLPNIADAYYQLGRIYQDWGKYEDAIAYYQQSRELNQQLGKEKDVANSWYWMAVCYRQWGKYEQALDATQQDLALHQQLDYRPRIALAYFQLGRIYQDWGKYEDAIAYYQQSRELNQQLGKEKDVASLWYNLADCYRQWGKYEQALDAAQQDLALRQQLDDLPNIADAYYQLGRIYQDWGKYEDAIAHHQQSRELYQQLGKTNGLARQLTRIANSQRQLARETADRTAAISLLTQAEQHLEQAIQLNIDREYRKNLAYDYIALSLVCSDFLRHIPAGDPTQPIRIAQFENTYPMGLGHLTALGQTVNLAEETLDIARAYLEIPALENLNLAESLTRQSLQTFEDFNRRRLQADALKLLGEIYKHRIPHQPDAATTAAQFCLDSRQLYQDLDIIEVDC